MVQLGAMEDSTCFLGSPLDDLIARNEGIQTKYHA